MIRLRGLRVPLVQASWLLLVLGGALMAPATPADAYMLEAVTSISTDSGEDKTQLQNAVQAAIDDVVANAVAFTPTVVALLDAKVIGDRIYLFVLVADKEGEEVIKVLLAERHGKGIGEHTLIGGTAPADQR